MKETATELTDYTVYIIVEEGLERRCESRSTGLFPRPFLMAIYCN